MSNIKSLKPFQEGYDPRRNTNGRPKGSKNWRTLLMRALGKKIVIDGRKIRIDELMVERIVRMASKGNLRAAKIVIDRVDGRVPEAEEIPYTEPQMKVEITPEEQETIERLFKRKPYV